MTQPASSSPTALDGIIDVGARQVVISPEQVALHLPIAGPTTRMLAYGVDCVMIFIIEVLLVVLLLATTPLVEKVWGPWQDFLGRLDPSDPNTLRGGVVLIMFAVFFVVQFAVEWSYFVVSELLTGGRSIGKVAVGLRVVGDGGLPLTPSASLVRNLLRMVDMLPGSYVVGLVAIVVSPQGKRLGDLAAGTIVVRLDKPPPAPALTLGRTESVGRFRFDRAQIRLVGPNERALLRQALRRVESLPPDRADAILETAVSALRVRIDYGPVETAERRAFLEALLRATERE